MKTIEEMAHDYLCAEIAHTGMNMINEHDAVRMAFLFAKTMQAEAEKRKAKKDTVSLTKDGNGNCLHLHHKKCMDCGACLEQWQPDWSQAPDDARYWAMDKDHTANFFKDEPEITNGNGWDFGGVMQSNNSHNYQGDWRNSLRKRP